MKLEDKLYTSIVNIKARDMLLAVNYDVNSMLGLPTWASVKNRIWGTMTTTMSLINSEVNEMIK